MSKKSFVFINRELSWLSFNDRVLQEADNQSVPLIERLKFLGIYSNNRDEFFRVRVATLKRVEKHNKKLLELMGEEPALILDKIQKTVIEQQLRFETIYQKILKELNAHNIFILDEKKLSKEQGVFVKEYFREKVMPLLFPIMLGNKLKFPYLRDRLCYLLVKLRLNNPPKNKYALIEIPTDNLSRFLVLPQTGNKHFIMLLDDVIRYCLDDVFINFDYDEITSYNIKLTRDADLHIDNDLSKSFIEKISKGLKERKRGQPVRLVYDSAMEPDILSFILKKIKLSKRDNIIPGGRYHNFKDFMSFPNIGTAALVYKKMPPLKHPDFVNQKTLFRVIQKKDVLLSYPYQSFEHIIDLLREASIDPKVTAIKITLYRVSNQSSIVKALINAVKNGKQVTAVIELQARFDEEANIYWANKLQEEGATVIYGVQGLKVHSKLFLISRTEKNKTNLYAHIGTGNFNENTARVYTDHSLLTSDKKITEEVAKVFDFYADNLKRGEFKSLLCSPFYMRKEMTHLINNEIKNARKGKPAYISIKLNNLVDAEMIRKLYEASAAGVKIKLMVRGMCSLVAGVKGLSENIESVSIVGRFLEHSRVFVFYNGGNEKYYISSGDWMIRNFDYRSEVAVPIYDKAIQQQLKKIIHWQWSDNVKARVLGLTQKNEYRKGVSTGKINAQEEIYNMFKMEK